MKKIIYTIGAFIMASNIFSVFKSSASNGDLTLQTSQEPSIYNGHRSHASHSSHYSSINSNKPNYRERLRSFLSSPSQFFTCIQSYFSNKNWNVDYMNILPSQEINVIDNPLSGSFLIITLSNASDIIRQYYVPLENDTRTFYWETMKDGFNNYSGRNPEYIQSCDFDKSLKQVIQSEVKSFQKQNLSW